MNCPNCGEKLAVFSRYCENCGTESLSTKDWCMHIGVTALDFCKKHIQIVAVIAGVLTIFIGFGIWQNVTNTIDPTEFIMTQVSGFNGDGRIDVTIDYQALLDRVLGPVPDKDTVKGYEKYTRYIAQSEELKNSLQVYADRTTGLQTGDFYIVTVDVLDKEAFKQCGVKVKEDSYQRTLQIGKDSMSFDEPIEIDLFSLIDLTFNGENGNGYIVVSDEPKVQDITFASGKQERLQAECYELWGDYTCYISLLDIGDSVSIEFYADKRADLVNGELITLTLNQIDAAELQNFGISIKNIEQSYTVFGLAEAADDE